MEDGSNPIYEPKEFTNYYLSLVDDEHDKVIFKPTKDKDEDKSSEVYDFTNSLKKRTLEFKPLLAEVDKLFIISLKKPRGNQIT